MSSYTSDNGDPQVSEALPTLQSSHDRKKRAQVVRACDSCRRQRIKCDSRIPCTACQARDSQCSNAVIKSITLPQAYREIERLRRKVHELEWELQQKREENNVDTASRDVNLDQQRSPHSHVHARHNRERRTWVQKGVHICAGQSTSKTWYGPSSLFYFITQVLDLLGPPVLQPASPDKLPGPVSASSLFDKSESTASPAEGGRHSDRTNSTSVPFALSEEFITLTQEEYFIELYWQSHHTAVFPILDETEFREHYKSSCTAEGNFRKPSPLIDIVIAISMQLGFSTIPVSRWNSANQDGDGTVVGRRYYLRCQKLLAYELESPVISTLQSQLLCAVYLCCANFQNMSDSACGTVVKTAYMLGLHLDPPEAVPLKEKEMRRRLWWAVYILDTKIGMKYGRPFLLYQTKFLPRLPEHTLHTAMEAGSTFGPLGSNLSWLSFHRQQTELFLVARTAYTALFHDGPGVFVDDPTPDNEDSVEVDIRMFRAKLEGVTDWANSVPAALKTTRLNHGHSLSTDSCLLDLEFFAPLWLQRQRLLLELIYHNLCVNLCRPFILDCSTSTSSGAEQLGVKCAQHAMTLTNIMHQVLSSTTILNGWHEAFQWQWNAAMTLVGFVLVYPQAESTADAWRSIDTSLDVLNLYSTSFAVAAKAADVVRRIRAEVHRVVTIKHQGTGPESTMGQTQRAGITQNPLVHTSSTARESALDGIAEALALAENGVGIDEMTSASLHEVLNMAFDVDQWAEPHMLWSDRGEPGA